MCEQVVLRFDMSIRENFSKSVSLTVTSESDKGAVMQISTVLGNVYLIAYGSIM